VCGGHLAVWTLAAARWPSPSIGFLCSNGRVRDFASAALQQSASCLRQGNTVLCEFSPLLLGRVSFNTHFT
jgi:hypothetical protein